MVVWWRLCSFICMARPGGQARLKGVEFLLRGEAIVAVLCVFVCLRWCCGYREDDVGVCELGFVMF